MNRVLQGDYQGLAAAICLLNASIIDDGRDSDPVKVGNYLRGLLALPYSAVFVAYAKGLPRGVLVIEWRDDDPEQYYVVRNLYVAPGSRGDQVAVKLMKAAATWAQDEDAKVCITTPDEPRPFYAALGFEQNCQVSVSSLKKIRENLQ